MGTGRAGHLIIALSSFFSAGAGATAADCNRNGIEDWGEITGGSLPDCNSNGIPDPCDILPVNYTLAARGGLPVGPPITAAAAADLDGDGDLDIATAHAGFTLAGMLWNLGEGKFSPPTTLVAELSMGGVATGDLDGDGRVDIVLGTQTGFQLLINRGSRRFSSTTFDVAQPNRPVQSAILADLDGDDRPDIAATAPFRVFVLVNPGNGSFSGLQASIPIGSNPVALAAARFDGDSDLDIVTANRLDAETAGNVSIVLNQGGGTFATPRNFGVDAGPTAVAAGDFDGDGMADIAASCFTAGAIRALLGAGDGTFRDGTSVQVDGLPISTSAADLDGDGDLDLASALIGRVGPGAASAALNHGDAGFAKAIEFPSGFQPFSIFAADLTGDGISEVAAGLDVGSLLVLEHVEAAHDTDCDRSGIPDGCELPGHDCNRNKFLDACDIASGDSRDRNGNGTPDECESDCNSNGTPDDLDVSSAASPDCNANGFPDECDIGPSAFRFDTADIASAPNGVLQLQSGDLDRDGRIDAFGIQQFLSAVVFWNGEHGFEPPVDHGLGLQVSAVGAADFDGDDDLDLVVGDAQQSRLVLLIQDQRSFGTTVTAGSVGFPAAVAAGDIDGDGDADIAAGDGTRAVIQFFSNDGSGRFTPFAEEKLTLMPAFFELADVDADGKVDLITARQETGLLAVHWNEAGRFNTLTDIPGRGTPGFISVADVDGDGDMDIVGAFFDGFTLAIQEGPRAFRGVDIITPIQFPFGFRAEDLDGDGDADIAAPSFLSTGNPALALLRSRGNASFDAPSVVEIDLFLGPITSGDYDGDGKRDLLASGQPFCSDGGCVFEPKLIAFLNRTHPSTSLDADRNGRPDECDAGAFRRGDASGNGSIDVADAVFTLRMLFQGGPAARCAEAPDADNDGTVGLADAVLILDFLFRGGPPPAAPGPTSCGADPDPAGSPGNLGCGSYDAC
jgi:hypothetical protein